MGGDESAGSGEKKRGIGVASGAVTRNTSASRAGVVTVLQVPPSAALVEEPGTTCMPTGMGVGGQSGAIEKYSGPLTTYNYHFCRALRLIYLIIYFCFQVSSRKSDIVVIVFPLARVTFKY
jgi:hypothetical protein